MFFFKNVNKTNCHESDRFSQDAALILSWIVLNIRCNKVHQTWLRKLPTCFCSHRSPLVHRSHLQHQHCNTSQMKQFIDPIINLCWKTARSERQLWTHLHKSSEASFTKVGSTSVFHCYQLIPSDSFCRLIHICLSTAPFGPFDTSPSKSLFLLQRWEINLASSASPQQPAKQHKPAASLVTKICHFRKQNVFICSIRVQNLHTCETFLFQVNDV